VKTLAVPVNPPHTVYPWESAATCDVLIGAVASRLDLSAVSLTGFGICNLPAGHERDGHPVCGFHSEYNGDLPFTIADLQATDQRRGFWAGPRRRQ
jgi:hypothetical protein